MTEIAFLRLSMNPQVTATVKNASALRETLRTMVTHRHHVYWRDPMNALRTTPFQDIFNKLTSSKDVTDSYLAALASHHRGWVATFDESFARKFDPVVRLVTWAL
jgi:predicted nucleic acid-binding protein